MGVYTNTNNPFGLYLYPRLKKIIDAFQDGTEITQDDIAFLIDEAARFSTVEYRVKSESFPIRGPFMDEEYEIRGLLKDLIDEMGYIVAHTVGKDGTYNMELPQFSNFHGSIDNMNAQEVGNAVRHALRMVKAQQKNFDTNGDNYTVVGHFKHLERRYDIELSITPDSDVDEIINVLIMQVSAVLEKEIAERQSNLKKLARKS